MQSITELMDDLYAYVDREIHTLASPNNWYLYSELRDKLDDLQEALKENGVISMETKQRPLVDINEASSVIMDFIGSEKYNIIVGSIENNARAGFNAGLSIAMALIMSECNITTVE